MAGKNQGEGNRDAARHYNEATQKFVKAGKVNKALKKAKDDPEAERKARARSKELDPQDRRDYSKPQK